MSRGAWREYSRELGLKQVFVLKGKAHEQHTYINLKNLTVLFQYK